MCRKIDFRVANSIRALSNLWTTRTDRKEYHRYTVNMTTKHIHRLIQSLRFLNIILKLSNNHGNYLPKTWFFVIYQLYMIRKRKFTQNDTSSLILGRILRVKWYYASHFCTIEDWNFLWHLWKVWFDLFVSKLIMKKQDNR